MCAHAAVIRAALFDIGNVILPFDFAPAMARLNAQSRRDTSTSWKEVERIKLAYEGGQLSRAQFLSSLSRELAFGGTQQELIAIWADVFSGNSSMDALLDRLHSRGMPLYLLSNTSDIHVDTFMKRFPIFGRFSGGIYSHEERLMKPDPEIFHRAIRRFRLVPAETLYVDDLAPNVEAAAALGFVALQYDQRDHAAFEAIVSTLIETPTKS